MEDPRQVSSNLIIRAFAKAWRQLGRIAKGQVPGGYGKFRMERRSHVSTNALAGASSPLRRPEMSALRSS
jgi:hypothetical protein